jgi:hypothetical protein
MLSFNELVQQSDYVYYNAQVVNRSNVPREFRYNDNQVNGIINKSFDYKLQVKRFSIDTSEIPIMYFPSTQFSSFLLNDQYSSADNNYFSITVSDNAVVSQVYLQHESFITSNPSDLRIFTIDQFIQILNKAVRTACNALVHIDQNRIPYFIYDANRGIVDLHAPQTWTLLDVSNFKLYMNDKLWRMFENFPHTKMDLDQGRTYRIDIFPIGDNVVQSQTITTRNTVINPSAGAAYFIMKGQYCTIYKFFQVRNLIFTTNSLPVRSEFLNSSLGFDSGFSNDTLKILKNFEFNLEGLNALYCRGIQNFVAQEPDYIDLEDSKEIKNIDIQIFYSDVHGKIFPLFVPPGSLTTIKLQFTRM